MSTPLKGKSGFSKSFSDSRNDLGYGRLSPKYFVNRVHGDPTFPYTEDPTDTSDVIDDIGSKAAVHKKLQQPRDYDPLPYNDTEAQSFVGTAKLGEATNALSPIPDLYKNRSRSPLGTSPGYPHGAATGFSSKNRPSGSKYGYSTMYGESPEGDEPAYTLEDIAEKQLEEQNLRNFIRLMILEIP
jgi:hypothetical protein